MLLRLIVAGCALALLAGLGTTTAQDKKAPKDKEKPTVWTREAEGIELTLQVSKDTLTLSAFRDDDGVTITCKITPDKDGTIKATVTEVVEKGSFPAKPPKGFEFSFKWMVKENTGTLSDLMGDGLDDARGVLEGEYKKKT
jgi:hypothetical protein